MVTLCVARARLSMSTPYLQSEQLIQYGIGHRSLGIKMSFFDVNSEVDNLGAEEERILASFTRRPGGEARRGKARFRTLILRQYRGESPGTSL